MVISSFGDIKMKNIDMPIWTEPIYKKEQLSTTTLVVPVEDITMLTVEFLIPDQIINYENFVKYNLLVIQLIFNFMIYVNQRPATILDGLFHCKGSVSISAVLKDQKWCEFVNANSKHEARGIELYEIVFSLTEKGLDHVNDIITLVFQVFKLYNFLI